MLETFLAYCDHFGLSFSLTLSISHFFSPLFDLSTSTPADNQVTTGPIKFHSQYRSRRSFSFAKFTHSYMHSHQRFSVLGACKVIILLILLIHQPLLFICMQIWFTVSVCVYVVYGPKFYLFIKKKSSTTRNFTWNLYRGSNGGDWNHWFVLKIIWSQWGAIGW